MSETTVSSTPSRTGHGLLAGKTALITGSSRGIGREIALEFARQGADVVVNARTQASAEALVPQVEALGVRVLAYGCDVSVAQEAEKMISDVLEHWKTLDILVNNAGITRDGLLLRMKEEDWDEVMNTNLRSAFHCTRAAVKAMMRQRRGAIINISSVVGLMGNPGQANYCASKAGLIGLTKSVAKEVASRNITVNAIAPGFITTDMTASISPEQSDRLKASIPLARMGEPSDVAGAAVFLASDAARYVTGHVLVVDGGMTM